MKFNEERILARRAGFEPARSKSIGLADRRHTGLGDLRQIIKSFHENDLLSIIKIFPRKNLFVEITMRVRWAVRVAYLGSEKYHGYQIQPGKATIEGYLEQAIDRAEIPATFGRSGRMFGSSGRTDRLVSALRQTIAFDLPADFELSLMRLNAFLPFQIRVWAKSRVSSSFHPRHDARSREYHYFFPLTPGLKDRLDVEAMKECLALLKGTHDFQNFTKTDLSQRNTRRSLDVAELSVGGEYHLTFKFKSRGFLWQQVRRMVNHVIQVGLGLSSLDVTRQLLTTPKTEIRSNLIPSPAPPEGLLLTDVEYDAEIHFEVDQTSIRAFVHRIRRQLERVMMRAFTLHDMLETFTKESP